jgi:two-component system cell cycle sensor histidine kinase/response regulator CckA
MRLTQLSVDIAGEMICWTRADGGIVYVNDSFCRSHGYSRDELLSMSMWEVDAALSKETWPEVWREERERGSSPLETEHRRKDGSLIPVEVVTHFVSGGDEEFNVGFARDISERRHAEELMRQSEQRLRESQKMEAVGQLAGGIAHDFNSLMGAILGYTDLLLAEPTLSPPSAREDLIEIRQACERAAELTKQILAFSRRQALRPKVVDLNGLIEGVEAYLRRSMGEDVELVTALGRPLYPVEVDAQQFEQVLLNLAANALDAMTEGGTLTVRTANARFAGDEDRSGEPIPAGEYVVLSVSDTGEGMDAATLARVYEPFYTTKPQGKGTGLGLSVVYGIVRQSRGHIWIDSEPGGGTVVSICLPASRSSN